MALRDKIATAARPFLDQGEQVQAAFPAQTASQWLAMAGDLPPHMRNQYPRAVDAAPRPLPRPPRIGPASGLWYRTANLGEDLRISKRFFGEIEAADAQAR